MADYRKDKIARHEKAYRDRLKRNALKNSEEPERQKKNPEDVKALIELWKKRK